MLGTLATYFDSSAVIIAAAATLVVSVALTIFAIQTKWDFTMMGGTIKLTKYHYKI